MNKLQKLRLTLDRIRAKTRGPLMRIGVVACSQGSRGMKYHAEACRPPTVANDPFIEFLVEAHTLMPTLLKGLEMINKLEEHLDFIGWGDHYERECSEDLRKELEKFKKETEQ